jgi:putative transposase
MRASGPRSHFKTMNESRGWHSRGYLPHYDDGAKIQSITYRLADALPSEVVARLEEQALDDEKRRVAIEHFLDAGHGSCVLREARCAEAVLAAWRHFDGVQYRLHAWVVMPNHVHILVEPLGAHGIGKIVGAWKSVSARAIFGASATAPGRTLRERATEGGRAPKKRHVWQEDYWDRFIRNEGHYTATVDYIHNNPVKAGLCARPEDWPWSSIHGSAGRWPAPC